jgi:hypothetical protein
VTGGIERGQHIGRQQHQHDDDEELSEQTQ